MQAPGPSSLFGIGTFPGFLRGSARIHKHLEHAERYGDIVCHDLGFLKAFIIRHPDDIKHVFVDNHAAYFKGRGIRKMRILLGDGLLTSEGELWRRQRKLAQPAFHRARLAALVGKMTDATRDMLDRWRDGQRVDLLRETMALTLRIAGTTLFSVDVAHEAENVGRALTVALHEAVRRTFSPFSLPLSVPTPRNVEYRKAARELDRVVYGIIENRRKHGGDADDVLAMLMAARDEETGEAMSDAQLRDEVMTLFLAGHETTANALAWTWALLSRNPGENRRLEDEVTNVLGDRAPSFEDLAALKRTRMIVDESLRLYPPAWIVGRTAIADDRIRGYRIPKGAIVAAAVHLAHRNPAYWPNPEGFDPDRFTPEASAARPRYAYLPFGAGPRTCIGNTFALMESQLVTAMIAQRFRVELEPGRALEPEPLITLRPRGGVPATLRAR